MELSTAYKFCIIVILLLNVSQFEVLGFRQQSVGIRGQLMCGDKPLANTRVKLWNKNRVSRDDQLAEQHTDSNGNFQLEGGVGGLFKMNVHFKIYHDCNRRLPCQRKVNLKIPDDYISRSSSISRWFDAGKINMEFVFPDEETSCIN